MRAPSCALLAVASARGMTALLRGSVLQQPASVLGPPGGGAPAQSGLIAPAASPLTATAVTASAPVAPVGPAAAPVAPAAVAPSPALVPTAGSAPAAVGPEAPALADRAERTAETALALARENSWKLDALKAALTEAAAAHAGELRAMRVPAPYLPPLGQVSQAEPQALAADPLQIPLFPPGAFAPLSMSAASAGLGGTGQR